MKNFCRLPLFFLLGFFFIYLSACSSSSYLIGAGAYSPAISRFSDDANAKIGTLAPLSYPIGVRAQQKGSLGFFESADINPIGQSSPEGGLAQYHSQWRVGITPQITTFGPFEFSFFSSAHFNILNGKGISIELNNGTGTNTFYTPGSTRTVQTINLGSELAFVVTDKWMLSQGFAIEAPFSKTRRQWSGFLTLWYRWKGKAL